jgi:hypothetical protein
MMADTTEYREPQKNAQNYTYKGQKPTIGTIAKANIALWFGNGGLPSERGPRLQFMPTVVISQEPTNDKIYTNFEYP